MSDTLHVKPIKHNGVVRVVRMPEKHNQILPEAGGTVPNNSYWQRRLKDGDVEHVKATKKSRSTKPAES